MKQNIILFFLFIFLTGCSSTKDISLKEALYCVSTFKEKWTVPPKNSWPTIFYLDQSRVTCLKPNSALGCYYPYINTIVVRTNDPSTLIHEVIHFYQDYYNEPFSEIEAYTFSNNWRSCTSY